MRLKREEYGFSESVLGTSWFIPFPPSKIDSSLACGAGATGFYGAQQWIGFCQVPEFFFSLAIRN